MTWDEIKAWYICNGYTAAASAMEDIKRNGVREAISFAIRLRVLLAERQAAP